MGRNFFFIFFLIPFTSVCQNQMVSKADGTAMLSTRYEKVEGSPYLTDNFSASQVKFWQNQKIVDVSKSRFDAFKHRLEFLDEKGSLKVVDAKHIQEFKLDGKTFRCGFEPVEPLHRTDFVEVLFDGKVQLLKLSKTRLESEMVFGNVANPSRFTQEVFYFIQDGKQITKIKPFNLKWLKFLGSHEKAVLDYMKTNGMNSISDENELTAIVKYYDSVAH